MTRLAPTAAAAHARAYIDFAIGDAALLELMWQSLKAGDATAEIQAAAGRFFATVQSQVEAGMASGALVGPDLEHLTCSSRPPCRASAPSPPPAAPPRSRTPS